MKTKYTWNIKSLEKLASGIVCNVHWELLAERENIIVSTYGCVSLQAPTNTIIAFEDLTKEEVIAWVEKSLSTGVENKLKEEIYTELELIKIALENKINQKLKPITENVIPNF